MACIAHSGAQSPRHQFVGVRLGIEIAVTKDMTEFLHHGCQQVDQFWI